MKSLNDISLSIGVPLAELQQMVGEENEQLRALKNPETTMTQCFRIYDDLYRKEEFADLREHAMRAAIRKANTFAECIRCYEKTVYDDNGQAAIDKALLLATTLEECREIHNKPFDYSRTGSRQVDRKEYERKAEEVVRAELRGPVSLERLITLDESFQIGTPDEKSIRLALKVRIQTLVKRRIAKTRDFKTSLEIIKLIILNRQAATAERVLEPAVEEALLFARTTWEHVDLVRHIDAYAERIGKADELTIKLMARIARQAAERVVNDHEREWLVRELRNYREREGVKAIYETWTETLRKAHEIIVEKIDSHAKALRYLRSLSNAVAEVRELRVSAFEKAVALAQTVSELIDTREYLTLLPKDERGQRAVSLDKRALTVASNFEQCLELHKAIRSAWGGYDSIYYHSMVPTLEEAYAKLLSFTASFTQCKTALAYVYTSAALEKAIALATTLDDCRWLLTKIPDKDTSAREKIIRRSLEIEGQLVFAENKPK